MNGFRLILLIALSAIDASAALVAAGHAHSCAWDGREGAPIVCWGNSDQNQLGHSVRSLTSGIRAGFVVARRPKQLAAGFWHTCALHESENGSPRVDCWGYPGWNLLDGVPALVNPLRLTMGKWHGCALDNPAPGKTEARCWGRNDDQQATVPKDLKMPDGLFAGPDFTCARSLEAGTVRCWGRVRGEFPMSRFPKLAADGELACAAGAQGIDCWSNHLDSPTPKALRVGTATACSLEAGKLSCWDKNKVALEIPSLDGVTDFAVGANHVCALASEGVRCFGSDSENQATVPTSELEVGPYLRGPGDARAFLAALSEFVYAFDATLLKTAAEMVDSPETSASMLDALRPLFVDFGYRDLKARYLDRMLGDSGNWPEPKALAREKALKLLVALLQSARDMVSDGNAVNLAVATLGEPLAEGRVLTRAEATIVTKAFALFRVNPYLSGRGTAGERMLRSLVNEK